MPLLTKNRTAVTLAPRPGMIPVGERLSMFRATMFMLVASTTRETVSRKRGCCPNRIVQAGLPTVSA